MINVAFGCKIDDFLNCVHTTCSKDGYYKIKKTSNTRHNDSKIQSKNRRSRGRFDNPNKYRCKPTFLPLYRQFK